jgi:hypothetical protein
MAALLACDSLSLASVAPLAAPPAPKNNLTHVAGAPPARKERECSSAGAACGTCHSCPAAGVCAPVGDGTADTACPASSASCAAGGCNASGTCKAATSGTQCADYTCANSATGIGQYGIVTRSDGLPARFQLRFRQPDVRVRVLPAGLHLRWGLQLCATAPHAELRSSGLMVALQAQRVGAFGGVCRSARGGG